MHAGPPDDELAMEELEPPPLEEEVALPDELVDEELDEARLDAPPLLDEDDEDDDDDDEDDEPSPPSRQAATETTKNIDNTRRCIPMVISECGA